MNATGPQYNGSTPPCCWPECQSMSLWLPENPSWPLCYSHSALAWDTIDSIKHGTTVDGPRQVRNKQIKQDQKDTRDRATRERKGSQPGFVYYIQINDQIKIGYAGDVKKRMKAYPPGAKLLAVEPGSPELEKARHTTFAHALVAGREWFSPDQAIDDHIQAVLDKHGDPARHAHHYRKSGRGDTMRTTKGWSRV